MSYTKFIHVFLDNHPSLDVSDTMYRNLMGITYLQNSWCSCGVNTNKVIYNSTYECTPQQITSLDMRNASDPIDLEILLNYRHYHSHDVSQCPKCSHERKQWYSIVDIPMIFICNFEAIRTSDNSPLVVPPLDLTVECVHGRIKLKAIGYISHSHFHWTSSIISPNRETELYYDDLKGRAVRKTFSLSKLSNQSTSGIVYLREFNPADGNLTKIELSPSSESKVQMLDINMQILGEGYLINQFIDDVSIVLVTSVLNPQEKLMFQNQQNSHHGPFIQDWLIFILYGSCHGCVLHQLRALNLR